MRVTTFSPKLETVSSGRTMLRYKVNVLRVASIFLTSHWLCMLRKYHQSASARRLRISIT